MGEAKKLLQETTKMRAFIALTVFAALAVAVPVAQKCKVDWTNSENWPTKAKSLDSENAKWDLKKTEDRSNIVQRLNSERKNSKDISIRKGHEIPTETAFAQFGGWKFCKISKTTWKALPQFVKYPADSDCKKENLRCNAGKCYCC